MRLLERTEILLKPEVRLTLVENGIYSVEMERKPQSIDRWAGLYDLLIDSRVYNALVWGTSPKAYRGFAALAHRSAPQLMLDAGCGTMAATAEVHAANKAFVVGVDTSLGMLRRAKARLEALGALNVMLILGDVENLPFRSNAFDAVLFMATAHLFPDDSPAMDELKRVLMRRGQLHLSSPVLGKRSFGDRFLRRLQAKGEVKTLRTPKQVLQSLRDMSSQIDSKAEGNMFFASAVR